MPPSDFLSSFRWPYEPYSRDAPIEAQSISEGTVSTNELFGSHHLPAPTIASTHPSSSIDDQLLSISRRSIYNKGHLETPSRRTGLELKRVRVPETEPVVCGLT
ncbi:hypothetical protein C362_01957 [Cryptococcus neoformans Bt1]|nr:hypothetical protein C362_01957 [Cryptococcus neoformans var. grubii Bt1]